MCGLFDITHYERQGNVTYLYDIDEYGGPTRLLGTLRRFDPRNIEQWIVKVADDLIGVVPYRCGCGAELHSWDAVMNHCDLYPCRDCHRATPKWDGWDYRCPACDQAANPDYHDRNPGYYGR